MDLEVVLVLGALVAVLALEVGLVLGSVDALAQPRDAWARAGARRSRWVWQAFGVFALPLGIVYSAVYVIRIRPRLLAAARDIAIERRPASAPTCGAPSSVTGTSAERLKIGMPWSVAGMTATGPLLGYVLGWAVASGADFDSVPWGVFLGSAVGVAVAATLNLAFGITLTSDDLVMRGLIRRRVAWVDIVAVTQEAMLGSRYVRVWTRAGRGRRLRAPLTQLGVGRRRFDADLALLERWWHDHTAPTTS